MPGPVWIVVPTYCEAGNVEAMVRALRAAVDAHVLVVDDGSPDGTGRIADADFSHDPAAIPRLLHAVAGGADLALGSRYIPGGGVEGWTAWHRIVSRAGCAYARLVLRVPVRDLTGGFKCFRAETLEAIDFRSARSRGYAFQVELTYRALRAGLRVAEVPITFRERREGESKLDGQVALEAAWRIPALRFGRPRLQSRPAAADPTGW